MMYDEERMDFVVGGSIIINSSPAVVCVSAVLFFNIDSTSGEEQKTFQHTQHVYNSTETR